MADALWSPMVYVVCVCVCVCMLVGVCVCLRIGRHARTHTHTHTQTKTHGAVCVKQGLAGEQGKSAHTLRNRHFSLQIINKLLLTINV